MNRAQRLGLLVILLLATALRFYRVSEMPLRADEASSLYLSLEDPQAIIRVFAASDPHMPLYFLIVHYWTWVAGISELAARFPAIFVGILSVALAYALGRFTLPRRRNVAWLGAALVAVNPFLIWDAQDIYMYSFLTATTVLSFILFLRVFQPRAHRGHWIAYVIASAAGLYFHYFFVFILLAQFAVWLYLIAVRRIVRRDILNWIAAQVAIVMLFVPWLLVAVPLLATFRSDFIPPAGLGEMLQRALLTFTVGRTDTRMAPAWVEPSIGPILAFGFLVVFLYGLLASPKSIPASRHISEREGRIVLAIFLGIPLSAFFVYSLVRFPLFDERYVLYLSPAFSLILARGLANFWESKSSRWVGAAAIAFILLADGHSLYNYFYVPEFARSPDWHSFMDRLSADARSGDVLVQNYPDPALPYYLKNRLPRVLLPRTGSATLAEVSADMDRLTNKYSRIWFQPAPFAEWDTGGLVATWLNRHALETDAYPFRGLQLELYLPVSSALRQAKPIHATLDNQIRLVAFDLNRADGNATAKPGTHLRVVLYWQALEPIDRDYTVFVHLYRSDGQLESQQDNQPVRGTFPTRVWSTDEIVVDAYDLSIPSNAPRETFLLAAGMYDSQTLQRLSASDSGGNSLAENRVPLTEVTVEGTHP
jgi:4-amino-4-deoxy-L-arabinose transferase-like glycosyltransferase